MAFVSVARRLDIQSRCSRPVLREPLCHCIHEEPSFLLPWEPHSRAHHASNGVADDRGWLVSTVICVF